MDVDGPIIVEKLPSELGWKPLGNKVWLKPDGQKYIFPPEGKEIILVLTSPKGQKNGC